MALTPRYPDTIRQQAIVLYQSGKGYKAISSELSLPRDTVRNWITTYRLTGRTESVHQTGKMPAPETPDKEFAKKRKAGPGSLKEKEVLYADARREYESGGDSLLAIAKKHGLNYANFRNFLLQYHPESSLLHTYAKQSAQLKAVLAEQLAAIRETGDQLLQQMREELDSQLKRMKQSEK